MLYFSRSDAYQSPKFPPKGAAEKKPNAHRVELSGPSHLNFSAIHKGLAASLRLRTAGSGWSTAGEPNIAADRRAQADGNPAEDGCAGLDDHIIFDDRMPRSSPEQGAMASDVARGVGPVDYAAKPGFASPADYVMKDQLLIQAKTVLFTLLYSVIGSAVLYKFAALAIGLRASKQAEIEGLDISDHGERAYNL
jgi:hypothetical protein